jgi:hypothetical protein
MEMKTATGPRPRLPKNALAQTRYDKFLFVPANFTGNLHKARTDHISNRIMRNVKATTRIQTANRLATRTRKQRRSNTPPS